MGANVRFRCLSDFGAHRANLRAECLCGHKGVLDAIKLRRWFYCHRWNDALEVVGTHLRCSVCLGRPIRLRPTPEKPDRPEWMALEHDWKDLVRRLRG